MRRNVIDNVTIVEPPLEELTKRDGGFKHACFTGCGCLIIVIIAAIIGVRIYLGSGPQTFKILPPGFPSDITVYDPENIETVTYISGKYKNRGIEIAAFFPKIILSPLLLSLNKDIPSATGTTPIEKQGNYLRNLWKVISTPTGDHRDTYQIEWRNIDADQNFVISYYKTELRKKRFTIEVESEGQGVKQFSFSREDGLSGSLYTKNDETKGIGTDYIILTINLPETEGPAPTTPPTQ